MCRQFDQQLGTPSLSLLPVNTINNSRHGQQLRVDRAIASSASNRSCDQMRDEQRDRQAIR